MGRAGPVPLDKSEGFRGPAQALTIKVRGWGTHWQPVRFAIRFGSVTGSVRQPVRFGSRFGSVQFAVRLVLQPVRAGSDRFRLVLSALWDLRWTWDSAGSKSNREPQHGSNTQVYYAVQYCSLPPRTETTIVASLSKVHVMLVCRGTLCCSMEFCLGQEETRVARSATSDH